MPARTSKGIILPYRIASLRLSLAGLMLLCVGLVTVGRAEAYMLEQARDAIADAARPVLELFAGPVKSVRRFFGQLGQLADLYAENERLRAENERLLEWKAAALRLERTLERYNALLNVSLNEEITYVTARVVGESGSPFVRTLILNAGRNEHVRRGQAVVAGEGLIGRVIGTGEHAARVLLLTDLNSRIPVLVEPAMTTAILAGDNGEAPRILYAADEADLQAGDSVITSDDGGTLPRGLPIGILEPAGEPGEWRVKLHTSAARADFVRVIDYAVPTLIDVPKSEDLPPFVRRAIPGLRSGEADEAALPASPPPSNPPPPASAPSPASSPAPPAPTPASALSGVADEGPTGPLTPAGEPAAAPEGRP